LFRVWISERRKQPGEFDFRVSSLKAVHHRRVDQTTLRFSAVHLSGEEIGISSKVFKRRKRDGVDSLFDHNVPGSRKRGDPTSKRSHKLINGIVRQCSVDPPIAQIEGRVRGAGSEFVLACDMRFAARHRAIFGQFEPAFGQIPGGGAAQYLTRLMGRARALEVMLTADDYDADLAERYGD
jgi:hypothetical protein